MKSAGINLFILDDHTLMVGNLSKYLINKFGERINISIFFDADKCIRNIDEDSHVIILDYHSYGKAIKNGQDNFDYIKNQKPETEVTLITSDKDAPAAAADLERGAISHIGLFIFLVY